MTPNKTLIIYTLAGLGFDQRAFEHIEFPQEARVCHLDWIDPLHPKERIADYASRMLHTQMDTKDLNQPLYLIGHSFGGVMMQEIAAQLEQVQGIILLSSIKAHAEKPWMMRWFYWLPVWWLTIKFFSRLSFPLWGWFYGYSTAAARRLFHQMIARFSNRYYRWATKTIAYWRPKKNRSLPPILSIHGTRDQMFYYRNIKTPKKPIPKGNHFMLYLRAKIVSQAIQEQINLWEGEQTQR